MRLVHASFPRGLPAAGLLILRVALGALAEFHGWRLASSPNESALGRCIGAGAMILGGAIQIGGLTSMAAVLLGLGAIAEAVAVTGGITNAEGAGLELGVVGLCIVVALTGPGAHSVDALLFGPREILLPSAATRPVRPVEVHRDPGGA